MNCIFIQLPLLGTSFEKSAPEIVVALTENSAEEPGDFLFLFFCLRPPFHGLAGALLYSVALYLTQYASLILLLKQLRLNILEHTEHELVKEEPLAAKELSVENMHLLKRDFRREKSKDPRTRIHLHRYLVRALSN